jgi:hypothetical protein
MAVPEFRALSHQMLLNGMAQEAVEAELQHQQVLHQVPRPADSEELAEMAGSVERAELSLPAEAKQLQEPMIPAQVAVERDGALQESVVPVDPVQMESSL